MRHSAQLSCIIVLQLLAIQSVWAQDKPNIVLINLDDADSAFLSDPSLVQRYPNMSRMASEGLKFTNLHVTSPICGPSRACLMRSQYAHRTGILTNNPRSITSNGFDGSFRSYMNKGYLENDLSIWMKNAGYRTMMLGKFLHSHAVNVVPPGWDDFYHSMGAKYFETHRFTNRDDPKGRPERLPPGKYRTTVEQNEMIQLINSHVVEKSGTPFFLYLAPLAPHKQEGNKMPMSEPKYANWWQFTQVPRTPDFDEVDNTDKTGVVAPLARLKSSTVRFIDNHYANRLRALRSFDDMLGSLFQELNKLGIGDNTYVFLTSDNGFSLGHQRYFGKIAPFDRITRVPLFVIGPNVPQGERADHLLAHLDIGPTLIELAGGKTPRFVDGKSFAKLIVDPKSENERSWREPILIESYISNRTLGRRRLLRACYTAVRLYDEIYIEYASGAKEYYDLANDPFQLENQYASLSALDQQFLAFTIRDIKRPSMSPISAISVPFGRGKVVARKSRLRGFCSDDSGVGAALLAIKDAQTKKFWNGKDWQDEFVRMTAELANRGGQISEWSYQLNLHKSTVPKGKLVMTLWAYDESDNCCRRPKRTWFTIDRKGPEVTLDLLKTRTQAFDQVAEFAGMIKDDHSRGVVRLVIRDRIENRFWNGDGFQDRWTTVRATVRKQRWSHSAKLPSGDYEVIVRGKDESGNLSEVLQRQFFKVSN